MSVTQQPSLLTELGPEDPKVSNTLVPKSSRKVIRVAVPRPLHSAYDYALPENTPTPEVGARVRVPFGHSTAIALCIEVDVESDLARLKSVQEVIDDSPFLTQSLLDLAVWMTQYYHYPLGEILATMLPSAARKGSSALISPPDYWRICASEFSNSRAKGQARLFTFLTQQGPTSTAEILAAGHTRTVLHALASSGHIEACEAQLIPPAAAEKPTLNEDQLTAVQAIIQNLGRFQPFLLDGVTGSGKTEVYLRAMEPVIENNQQVLVLVPEIALTPQTLSRFQKRFTGVGMMHSSLSDTARLQTWLKCKSGQINVLIGTRSAVFTPFADLALIIVDEEHDSSYKQQEGLRYSARDIAIKRAQDQRIPVVLGSATPALESIHNASRDRYQTLMLPARAGGAQMPSYHLIDMRGVNHDDGLSIPLQHVIKRHLAQEGQVLIYLNRRGYSPTLLCAACGWQANCSACDAKLTLHTQTGSAPAQLICHHCTLRYQVPKSCDNCGQKSLLPVGIGTQRTESGLGRLFGQQFPVYRIDRDNVRSAKALEAQLDRINTGEPCLMVGTQMLAKGHHFPNVTLVAVINADAGFLSPDFRAPERTAQLIVQVAGRAGRAHRPGEVWIQTFQPDNPTLLSLINEGYAGFAQQELANRNLAGMPPARPMAMLRAEADEAILAESLLATAGQQLRASSGKDLEILGPVAAPLTRIANRTRFQLMLIGNNRRALHAALDQLRLKASNRKLRWSIDIDPYDSL